MQALSFFKYLYPDIVVPGHIRGFPDVNARSPLDPVYMLSSADTFKLITQFSDIEDRSEIKLENYIAIWAYATDAGWREVYINGGQLFFVANLQLNNPVVKPLIVRTTVVDIDTLDNQTQSVDLLRYVAKHDPMINAAGVTTAVRHVWYIDSDGKERQMGLLTSGILYLEMETFTLRAGSESGNLQYRNPPTANLRFKVEYALQYM